jgi:hypothetical protein
MPETSNQSKDNDAVLGGQATPPTGEVVSEWERLGQNFTLLTTEQRISTLSDALQYGEEGIDLLIKTLNNDKELTVRATAYRLLQGVQSRKAQQAIARGIPLNIGDKIYSVYASSVAYGDDLYYIADCFYDDDDDSLTYIKVEDDNYVINANIAKAMTQREEYHNPKLVSHHVFRETAEAEAESLHRLRLLDVRAFTFYWGDTDLESIDITTICPEDDREDFDIDKWCADNKVSLALEEYENDWEFRYRLMKHLQESKNAELLGQLWTLLSYGRLAFVHDYVIDRRCHLRLTKALSGDL